MIKLPIGYDNFAAIREQQLDFIDKSLLIKELLDDYASQIMLITRPRRFGKTLNLSMLQHFFAETAYGKATAGMFDNLKIAQCGSEYMQHQGKYPVIFITLKDVKNDHYDMAYANLVRLMSRVYQEHQYLLHSEKLTDDEKKEFRIILTMRADESAIQVALMQLCYYLYQHHGVKPWLLIDEYDTPLQAAYVHGYLHPMLSTIRGIFSMALKTNNYLNRAVITGILQIAKQNLFSDLNNIKSYSILQPQYSQYFGFTEVEMSEILKKSGLEAQSEKIRNWYNGYKIGDTILYNPWSIANCIYEKGDLRPYWVHTSGNVLIKKLLAQGDLVIKKDLELLLRGETITAMVHTNTVFDDLDKDASSLYSLLLLSGYLKAIKSEQVRSSFKCSLIPPNQEVLCLYQDIIINWFSEPMGYKHYEYFLNALVQGHTEEFTHILQDFLLESLSVFDVKGKHPEIFYHGFVLGMMISLKDTHEVRSNQESGGACPGMVLAGGRYDVMLIPKDRSKLGLILEFKTVHDEAIDLDAAARIALEQITERNYAAELRQCGIQKILSMGLAFRGKQVVVLTA